jgi:hypothetical protein
LGRKTYYGYKSAGFEYKQTIQNCKAEFERASQTKEWFRKLQPAPSDWNELRALITLKYGDFDADDIRMKLDAIK